MLSGDYIIISQKDMIVTKFEKLLALENTLDNFRLTKIGSCNEASMVGVGEFESGELRFIRSGQDSNGFTRIQALVTSNGDSKMIRTSPIIRVNKVSDNEAIFETKGGVYKLERLRGDT
jgi:hypothetical protein